MMHDQLQPIQSSLYQCVVHNRDVNDDEAVEVLVQYFRAIDGMMARLDDLDDQANQLVLTSIKTVLLKKRGGVDQAVKALNALQAELGDKSTQLVAVYMALLDGLSESLGQDLQACTLAAQALAIWVRADEVLARILCSGDRKNMEEVVASDSVSAHQQLDAINNKLATALQLDGLKK